MRNFIFLFGALLFAQDPTQPQAIGVISLHPPRSPAEISVLESKVAANPADLDSRISLLQFYAEAPPFSNDPARRLRRLEHILYLVDHDPEVEACGQPVAFVSRSDGPYANADDHLQVRTHWMAATNAHRSNTRVIVNAARFLTVEDQSDAEDVLRRAVAASPDDREIAANLGFLYARQILNPTSREKALAALEQSVNPFVLAAAGTALPNLAMSASGGRQVEEGLFPLASSLSARARRLAPGDPEIQGPMPMISYFSGVRDAQSAPMPPRPSGIRVEESVQAARLTRQTQPEYPELARNAGIRGSVKLAAVIARDGTIQSLEVISGHPLLIPAAIGAVKTWVYQPTLLNGAPVEVSTTITVSW